MKKTLTTIVIALAVSACGAPAENAADTKADPAAKADEKTDAPAEEEQELDLTQAEIAAELANAIAADPDSAEKLLAEKEMTLEEFDAMLFEVAQDPVLAEAYAKARSS